jgi:transposase-like protein
MAGITDADLKALKIRSRKRFSDEQIAEALQYMVDNPGVTMEETAEKFNMTSQTLGFRRDRLIEKRGIVIQESELTGQVTASTAPEVAKVEPEIVDVPKPVTKVAVAKPPAKRSHK